MKAFALVTIGLVMCSTVALADDKALLAATFGGSIQERPWGYAINTREGTTHVMRRADGYTVTTPQRTFFLTPRHDGYALIQGQRGVRQLPPDAVFDLKTRRRR